MLALSDSTPSPAGLSPGLATLHPGAASALPSRAVFPLWRAAQLALLQGAMLQDAHGGGAGEAGRDMGAGRDVGWGAGSAGSAIAGTGPVNPLVLQMMLLNREARPAAGMPCGRALLGMPAPRKRPRKRRLPRRVQPCERCGGCRA